MNIEGVLVPIITPFNAQGEIDFSALETLLERLLTAGVSGIIACGTTGEYYTLNKDERSRLLQFISEKVGSRALLIAGANDLSTTGAIVLAKQAKALGYQGLMLAPPIYCLPQQHEIITHFKTVSVEADMPIIMYNFPARSGVEIGIEAVIELSSDKNIVGIKESSGDFSRALTLLNADLKDFTVVCGSDDQAADYLFWGARAWIGGAANYLPDEHVQMLNAAKAGEFNTVRTIMRRIMPVIQNMESADYNQKAKLGCTYIGIPAGDVRPPLLPISENDKRDFLDALQRAKQ